MRLLRGCLLATTAGGALATLDPAAKTPVYHGCLLEEALTLPYCNSSLSHEARVQDLTSRLTLDEKISLLSPTQPPYCACHTPPIKRLGLPNYKWLTETNTDVQGGYCKNGQCTTVFIGPTGMAASFNRTSWRLKGDVISTELRASNNHGGTDVGLTGFGPNINTVKDPRYGRNSELAGEDPFLSGSYAVAYLQGMQQISEDSHHIKMLAYVKHYTAYSVEANRFTFRANVSQYDFWDSYLPQYEMAFKEGKASGAMCSYFAANGVSSCGSDYLMNQVVRKFWNRSDAVFMSDCSAVANMVKNGYASGPEDASAKALNGGLDVYGGWNDNLWGPPPYGKGMLHKAIAENRTTEARVDLALKRTMLQKMKSGLFDPLDDQEWTRLQTDVIGSALHTQVSHEAALQGMVLLKNTGQALPLQRGSRVAVVGPMAIEGKGLFSDYAQPHAPFDTIAAAITRVNQQGETSVASGVQVTGNNASGIDEALSLVRNADVVVLALGNTKQQEHETMDRANTKLPGLQEKFAHEVVAAAGAKAVVLLLCNGGALSFDSLLEPVAAVIEAFNPAQHGPRALADLLFGLENRWGKLPITIYGENYSKELDIKDMSFTTAPGRSYRYYTGTPLYRFGDGMSYTSFAHNCSTTALTVGFANFTCTVKNTGAREGDEVLQVYHRLSDSIRSGLSHPVPFRRLIAFDRLSLARAAQGQLFFSIPMKSFALTNADGDYELYPGKHHVIFSRGLGHELSLEVEINQHELHRNLHPETWSSMYI